MLNKETDLSEFLAAAVKTRLRLCQLQELENAQGNFLAMRL